MSIRSTANEYWIMSYWRRSMGKLHIPHDAFVFVGDGRKALFLRNAGDEKFPDLKTERVFVDENPPTHEQGTDRPGRAFKRAGTNLRSGVGDTDWHELEEHRFGSPRRRRDGAARARAQNKSAHRCRAATD